MITRSQVSGRWSTPSRNLQKMGGMRTHAVGPPSTIVVGEAGRNTRTATLAAMAEK